METRAHFALIGAFTLAVVVAAFGFVFWFSGGSKPAGLKTFRIVFSSSVSGLSRGSTVLFNGLRVGQVTQLGLSDDPNQVYADVDVDERIPVKTDTKARLEYQGFTGVASVALSGGGADAPVLVSQDRRPPTLMAERSDYQNILENLQSLSSKADDVLDKTDHLLADNQAAINETVHNAQTFTQALAVNSGGIKDFMSGLADLGKTIKPLSSQLTVLSGDLDTLVKSVDPAKVKDIVANADSFTSTLASNKSSIDSLLKNAATVAQQLGQSTAQLNTLLTSATNIAQAVDPKKLSATVQDISQFADALNSNRETTNEIFKNTAALTAKLNSSADKIDGVLAAAQGFLGQPGSKGMFDQVSETAQSIRRLADNLDKRTKEISDGINRFTGPGLRDYQALATDGRKTLQEIDATVRSLKRDPQQVIFGPKSSVPEYGGR